MADSTINSAQFFTRNNQTSVWFKLDSGESIFQNVKIAQSNLDSALMCVDSDLTLYADCDISFDTVSYAIGDDFLDDKGKVVTGERAGIYVNAGSKSINIVVDYASAVASNRAANRLADRLADKAEARLLAKEQIKAALKAAKTAVVAPVEQADAPVEQPVLDSAGAE